MILVVILFFDSEEKNISKIFTNPWKCLIVTLSNAPLNHRNGGFQQLPTFSTGAKRC